MDSNEISLELIVVDNGSTDDSLKMIASDFPQVNVIKNDKNVGFARANNQGLKKARGEYVLLLNSDTVLETDSLKKLISDINKEKNIGVLGGLLKNSDQSIQPSAGFFPSLLKVFLWMSFIDDIPLLYKFLKPYHIESGQFYKNSSEVDWITGACMMIKREVYEKTGGFDEHIFMYGEEVEWCYRIKNAGYRIKFCPDSVIYHLKGGSGEGKYAGIIQEMKSLNYIYRKHKPVWQQKLLPFIIKFGALLRVVLFGIIMGNGKKAHIYAQILSMAG